MDLLNIKQLHLSEQIKNENDIKKKKELMKQYQEIEKQKQELENILARSYQGHCGDNCMCDKCKEHGIGIYFNNN